MKEVNVSSCKRGEIKSRVYDIMKMVIVWQMRLWLEIVQSERD